MTDVVHGTPTDGLTPCCRRTPFELPRDDRMTSDAEAVTCSGRIPPVFDSPTARTLRRWADEAAKHDPRHEEDYLSSSGLFTERPGRPAIGRPVWMDLGYTDGPVPERPWLAVDDRHGIPARVEHMPRVPEFIDGIPHATTPRLNVHRRAVRVERHVLPDEATLWMDRDMLARALKEAADDLARRMFADCPLALATIVRTGIVPWDIEYQTTIDGATLERVTRLVEYERGARA